MIRLLEKNELYWDESCPFENVFMLCRGKEEDANNMALLRRSKNIDSPMLWQMLYRHSIVNFKTLADAWLHCRKHGWL